MRIELLVLAGLLVVAAMAAMVLFKRRAGQATPLPVAERALGAAPATPFCIGIGEHPDRPVVTFEASNAQADYNKGRKLDIGSASISRLSALLQAVPSVLVAGEAAGKQLMEVVINGDLVRAADGNGMRAFSMGAKGIVEHARLFEVQQLQAMINCAAIWQIASVVVAQKHLADISAKLDEIKQGITQLSQFLDNQRRARIEAACAYLEQAHQTIQAGELPASMRDQLEDCERDLLEIQIHLQKECRQVLDKEIEHKEMIGTEDLAKDIARKIADHDDLAADLALCIRARTLAWHVLSLYPGEPKLKQVRRQSVQQAIDTFQSFGPAFSKAIEQEIGKVHSRFNFASTLDERRAGLKTSSDGAVHKLGAAHQAGQRNIDNSAKVMLEHDAPSRMLFQFDKGVLVGASQAS
jgi:hypothetical protein